MGVVCVTGEVLIASLLVTVGALAQPRVPSAAMAATTEVIGCIPRPMFSKAKTVREFCTVLPNKTINKEKLHTYKA